MSSQQLQPITSVAPSVITDLLTSPVSSAPPSVVTVTTPTLPGVPGAITSGSTTTATAATAIPSDPVAPKACSIDCDDAYDRAQQVPVNSDCAADSTFRKDLAKCRKCVEEAQTEAAAAAILEAYIVPKEAQLARVCSDPEFDFGTTITSEAVYTFTAPNGDVVLVTTKFTTTQLGSGTVSSTASRGTASGQATGDPAPSPPSNKAWITGPVVGAICVVALLLSGFWFLRRRRRRQRAAASASAEDNSDNPTYEKAQLHSDCVPRRTDVHPMELEGSYPKPVPEMGANEVAAQEMSTPNERSPGGDAWEKRVKEVGVSGPPVAAC